MTGSNLLAQCKSKVGYISPAAGINIESDSFILNFCKSKARVYFGHARFKWLLRLFSSIPVLLTGVCVFNVTQFSDYWIVRSFESLKIEEDKAVSLLKLIFTWIHYL
jgi:hypothetical protein